jgi:hypothetical protein
MTLVAATTNAMPPAHGGTRRAGRAGGRRGFADDFGHSGIV